MTALSVPVVYEKGDCGACSGRLDGVKCAAEPRADRAAAWHLCALCEREPDRHGPAVRRMSRELAGIPEPTLPPPFVSPFTAPRTRPIRVGLTMPDFCVGGVASVTKLLADAIGATEDMELVGLAAWTDGFTSDRVLAMFPGVPRASGRNGIRALAAACDVLVCQGSPQEGEWTAGLPCRRVLVSHGICDFTRSRLAWAARADALAAVSRTAAGAFPGGMGETATVIPNPPLHLTPRRTRAEVRAGWGVGESEWVVGYVGRMSAEKRPWALLDALAFLPPWWKVALVGPFPERAEDWIDARGVRDRVVLPGPTDDPAGAMLACDAVALTSEVEGWPVVTSEAWWLGVPHLSTPVGAAAERPEYVRLLPEDADGAGIAAALLADHADPVGTRARALAAQDWARRELGTAAFGQRWTDLIRSIAPATGRAVILFAHHQGDEVTKLHHASLAASNPGVPIIPVYDRAGLLPGAVPPLDGAVDVGQYEWQWGPHQHPNRNADTIAYRWWLHARGGGDTPGADADPPDWVYLVEYDTLCTTPLAEAFAPAGRADVAGAIVVRPADVPDWEWWPGVEHLPAAHRAGVLPSGCVRFSRRALDVLATTTPGTLPYTHDEARVGSGALAAGLTVRAVPGLASTLRCHPDSVAEADAPGVYHPVRQVGGYTGALRAAHERAGHGENGAPSGGGKTTEKLPPELFRPSHPPTAGRQAVDRITAALACDYRVPLSVVEQAACGCGGRRAALCLLGKSRRDDQRVSLGECVACAGDQVS